MVLNIIGWSFVAAVAAWGLTLSCAKYGQALARAALEDQIRYWHAEAVKARELAAQLKHEIAAWSKGCQQGRQDVIAIMPLLVAEQDRLARSGLAEATEV
jgi:invasion protein IalB